MPFFDGILGFLDSRSFGTVWFWIMLVWLWSQTGREVLGVPVEIAHRVWAARPGPHPDDAEMLLDWLSLQVPRWRIGRRESAWLLAGACFLFSSLAVLGFQYGLELAQALLLLALPFAVRFGLQVRLAARLRAILGPAQSGRLPVTEAATRSSGMMRRHRWHVTAISILAVTVAAMWGTLYMQLHPNGL